jgi:Fe(3+) dicitrate transport protein
MFVVFSLLLAAEIEPAVKAVDKAVDKASAPALPGVEIFSGRKRRRTAGSAHKLSEKSLQRQASDDIHRVLAEVPGVYVREEEGYGLRPNIGLRGASSDRSAKITLMEDGILLAPAPYSAPAAYYFPMSGRLVGLEVFKGPAAIQFGPQTLGGALNLLSRQIPQKRPLTLLRTALGSHGYYKGHFAAGGVSGNFGAMIEGLHLRADGHQQIDGGRDSGFQKNEGLFRGLWRSKAQRSARHRVDLKLGYADEVSNASYLGLTRLDFSASPHRRYLAGSQDRMTWQRKQFVLDHSMRWAGGRLRTALYRHELERSWRKVAGFREGPELGSLIRSGAKAGSNAIWLALLKGEEDSAGDAMAIMLGTNARRYESQGLQTVLQQKLGDHRLHLGLRLHHDGIAREHSAEGFLMQQGELASDGRGEQTVLENHAWTRALATHFLDEWRLSKRLFLSFGSRLELMRGSLRQEGQLGGDNEQIALLPGIGIFHQTTKALGLLAGLHRGFSPVAPGQASEIKPESSINAEAGLRYREPGKHLELISFANAYSNMLGACTQSRGCPSDLLGAQFNAGAVDIYGLEAAGMLAGTMLKARWELKAAYTFTASNFGSSFDSASHLYGEVEQGDELPYVPVHQGKLSMRIRLKPVTLDLSGLFVGSMRDLAGQGEVGADEGIAAHQLIDATLRWKVAKRLSLRLGARNLLDSNYMSSMRPFGARAGAPRQLLIGLDFGS